MEVASVMYVGHSRQELLHDFHYLITWQAIGTSEPFGLSNVVQQCALHVFENQVHVVPHPNHFLQFYYVGVVEATQSFHLTKAHSFIPTFKLSFHFLDCNCLPRGLV